MPRNLTDTLKLTAPTVHLNGTSDDDLYKQLRVADKALRFALEKLYEAAPNARDYYVQGDGAFEQEELTDLIFNVLEQRDARKAARS